MTDISPCRSTTSLDTENYATVEKYHRLYPAVYQDQYPWPIDEVRLSTTAAKPTANVAKTEEDRLSIPSTGFDRRLSLIGSR
jgi:hypothetical protein